jgi:hypothetical protein
MAKLSRLLDAGAREAALHFVLLWNLAQLRQAGKQGVKEAYKEHSSNSGLPLDRFAFKYVERAAMAEGERILVQREAEKDETPPTRESIKEALEAFSKRAGFASASGLALCRWRDAIRLAGATTHLEASSGYAVSA